MAKQLTMNLEPFIRMCLDWHVQEHPTGLPRRVTPAGKLWVKDLGPVTVAVLTFVRKGTVLWIAGNTSFLDTLLDLMGKEYLSKSQWEALFTDPDEDFMRAYAQHLVEVEDQQQLQWLDDMIDNAKGVKKERLLRVRGQVQWIKDHGGDLDGYIARYGDPGVPVAIGPRMGKEHFGEGGTLIYCADLDALNRYAELAGLGTTPLLGDLPPSQLSGQEGKVRERFIIDAE
jgi:hypothetical protein